MNKLDRLIRKTRAAVLDLQGPEGPQEPEEPREQPEGGSVRSKLDAILALLEQMQKEAERPMGTKQAAEFLGLSVSYILKLTSRGEIAHTKSAGGKRVYFSRGELTAWARAHPVKTREQIKKEVQNANRR